MAGIAAPKALLIFGRRLGCVSTLAQCEDITFNGSDVTTASLRSESLAIYTPHASFQLPGPGNGVRPPSKMLGASKKSSCASNAFSWLSNAPYITIVSSPQWTRNILLTQSIVIGASGNCPMLAEFMNAC